MKEKEFFDSYVKLQKKDPEKAEAIFRAYQEDPTRTWEDLELITSKDLSPRHTTFPRTSSAHSSTRTPGQTG